LDGIFICCLGGFDRALCQADNLNHFLSRRFIIKRLCDAHDRRITGEYEPGDLT
jgi:hypothetical protein